MIDSFSSPPLSTAVAWMSLLVVSVLALSCGNAAHAPGSSSEQSGAASTDRAGATNMGGGGAGGTSAGSASEGGTSNASSGAGGMPPAAPFLTDNLLLNGDAEQGTMAWLPSGQSGIETQTYGSSSYPSATDPGPAERGKSFFFGGENALSDAHQLVDLAPFAAQIASGARLTLSASLGGYLTQNDRAAVVVHLLAADASRLATVTLGGPDAAERLGITGLLAGTYDAPLPVATRKLDVHLVMTRSMGSNDGYADNLSLVLHD